MDLASIMRRRSRTGKKGTVPFFFLLFLSPCILAACGPAPGESPADPFLEITYLANEGFLLRGGGRSVLIDAFVEAPYSQYAAVPAAIHAGMVAGEPPFDSVDLALVSHFHQDHFQAGPAIAFLRNHPETVLASSPQVLEGIRSRSSGDRELAGRLREVLPAGGKKESLEIAGIRVDFLRLRHGGRELDEVHNLGHLIHIGDARILHIGDAEIDPGQFAAHGMPFPGLEVSLVPYWYFQSRQGKDVARDRLRGKLTVAVHVPPGDLQEVVSYLASNFPGVRVFRKPLDTLSWSGWEDD